MIDPGSLAFGSKRAARILVVDNNRDNLEILAARLRFKGYDVTEAVSGSETLAEAAAHAPDLILVGDALPDMQAQDVVRLIKDNDRLPFIAVMMLGSKDDTSNEVSALDAGADGYIVKPINFPRMEARIRAILRIKEAIDRA